MRFLFVFDQGERSQPSNAFISSGSKVFSKRINLVDKRRDMKLSIEYETILLASATGITPSGTRKHPG